jgi:hypothetical protein
MTINTQLRNSDEIGSDARANNHVLACGHPCAAGRCILHPPRPSSSGRKAWQTRSCSGNRMGGCTSAAQFSQWTTGSKALSDFAARNALTSLPALHLLMQPSWFVNHPPCDLHGNPDSLGGVGSTTPRRVPEPAERDLARPVAEVNSGESSPRKSH